MSSKSYFSINFGSGTGVKDENNNELVKYESVSNAVNEFTITNAASGSNAQISTTGSDANVSINLLPKGCGNVNILTNSAAEGGLLFYENSSDTGYHIGLKAPGGLTKSTIFTLPNSDGTSGQYLKTSGAGVLSFDTVLVDGIPGGNSGELQYNNGGSFAGIAGITANANTIIIEDSYNLHFGGSEHYMGSNGSGYADLSIVSACDINLTPHNDVNIPANVGLTFGDDGEKIEGNGTDLTIIGGDINLTPESNVNISGIKKNKFQY